jgi:hypothetical protein
MPGHKLTPTFGPHNPSPGEPVREKYRRQGEQRMRERIIQKLEERLGDDSKAWSPKYVITLINEVD